MQCNYMVWVCTSFTILQVLHLYKSFLIYFILFWFDCFTKTWCLSNLCFHWSTWCTPNNFVAWKHSFLNYLSPCIACIGNAGNKVKYVSRSISWKKRRQVCSFRWIADDKRLRTKRSKFPHQKKSSQCWTVGQPSQICLHNISTELVIPILCSAAASVLVLIIIITVK